MLKILITAVTVVAQILMYGFQFRDVSRARFRVAEDLIVADAICATFPLHLRSVSRLLPILTLIQQIGSARRVDTMSRLLISALVCSLRTIRHSCILLKLLAM